MSAFRPALRQATRLAPRAPRTSLTTTTKRFLSSDSPILATSTATVTGARNGHVSSPQLGEFELSMPKSLGGSEKRGTSNPEELFAAGYGACFQSAMAVSAPLVKVKLPEDTVVETNVHLIGDLKKADIGIRVDMKITASGISKADLEKVVAKTKTVCPYSRATEGNVDTNVTVVAN